MTTVWKQKLEITDHQLIELPIDARILCGALQGNTPCIWYETCGDAKMKKRFHIRIAGTGHEITESNTGYLFTFQFHDLVFHVFQVKEW